MSDPTIKLLLIEDNVPLTHLMGTMLAQQRPREGPVFSVIAANRLSEGLARLTAGDIDLTLLDLTLPDSAGLESLSRIRAHSPELPVVVLTAIEDENLALRALREGAQDYLIKGEINRDMLIRAIRYSIERKRGEEARSRLAAIVDSSSDAIIGMSLEGLVVSWNPGAERIFGYAFEDVIGRPISILVPTDSADELSVILEWLKRGDAVKDFEAVRQKQDGGQIHVAISISPINNSVGKIVGASMIARDINERIRNEKEREALLRQLQATLAQVKTLNGLLPICACCKKIRDDKGYWTQVEVYVHERSEAEFTHGICPECAKAYREKLKI